MNLTEVWPVWINPSRIRCSHLRMCKCYNWRSGLKWLARFRFTDGPPHALCPFRDKKASYREQKEILSQIPVFWSQDSRFLLAQLYTPSLHTPASGLLGSGKRSQSSSSPLPIDSTRNPEIKCNRGETGGYADIIPKLQHLPLQPDCCP